MRPGQTVEGPAILVESTGTTVVEAGWVASAARGGLQLSRAVPLARTVRRSPRGQLTTLENSSPLVWPDVIW